MVAFYKMYPDQYGNTYFWLIREKISTMHKYFHLLKLCIISVDLCTLEMLESTTEF